MLKLVFNSEIKQVYTEDKAELTRFLNWWSNIKGVQYLGESFIKETVKGNQTFWYSEFFGVYYDYVTQDIVDNFYKNKKVLLIDKIEKDVETIKAVHR